MEYMGFQTLSVMNATIDVIRSRVNEINKIFEAITKNIPVGIYHTLKVYSESMFRFLKYPFSPDVKVVVDANYVLPNVIGYVKYGESTLYQLLQHPLLVVYAPSQLEKEVEKNLIKIARKKGLSKSQVSLAWKRHFLPKIKILDTKTEDDIKNARELLENHEKDVPYVALYFNLDTHGFLTKEKRFEKLSEVRKWTIDKTKKIIAIAEKGVLSFFCISSLIPNILSLAFQITVGVLKVVWESIIGFIKSIVEGVRNLVSSLFKLPDWAKLALVAGTMITLSFNKLREPLFQALNYVSSKIMEFKKAIFNIIFPILEAIASIALTFPAIIYYLFSNIQETFKCLEMVNVNIINFYGS